MGFQLAKTEIYFHQKTKTKLIKKYAVKMVVYVLLNTFCIIR